MQYPLEFAALEKGQMIPNSELEMATGKKQSDVESFRLACLTLRDRIHRETALVCKVTSDGIYVMTDAEAAQHTARQFEVNRRGMSRQHELGKRVDMAALSVEGQVRHHRAQLRQASILAATTKAAKHTIAAARPRVLEESSG